MPLLAELVISKRHNGRQTMKDFLRRLEDVRWKNFEASNRRNGKVVPTILRSIYNGHELSSSYLKLKDELLEEGWRTSVALPAIPFLYELLGRSPDFMKVELLDLLTIIGVGLEEECLYTRGICGGSAYDLNAYRTVDQQSQEFITFLTSSDPLVRAAGARAASWFPKTRAESLPHLQKLSDTAVLEDESVASYVARAILRDSDVRLVKSKGKRVMLASNIGYCESHEPNDENLAIFVDMCQENSEEDPFTNWRAWPYEFHLGIYAAEYLARSGPFLERFKNTAPESPFRSFVAETQFWHKQPAQFRSRGMFYE